VGLLVVELAVVVLEAGTAFISTSLNIIMLPGSDEELVSSDPVEEASANKGEMISSLLLGLLPVRRNVGVVLRSVVVVVLVENKPIVESSSKALPGAMRNKKKL
jgi:hypothetical protein